MVSFEEMSRYVPGRETLMTNGFFYLNKKYSLALSVCLSAHPSAANLLKYVFERLNIRRSLRSTYHYEGIDDSYCSISDHLHISTPGGARAQSKTL